jgi:hypothetical protein
MTGWQSKLINKNKGKIMLNKRLFIFQLDDETRPLGVVADTIIKAIKEVPEPAKIISCTSTPFEGCDEEQ